jgi:hypothetical protein
LISSEIALSIVGWESKGRMTSKQIHRIFQLIAAALLLGAVFVFLSAPRAPRIGVGVVSYGKRSPNRSTWAHLGVTNPPSRVFNDPVRFSGNALLRVELSTGFRTNDIGPLAPLWLVSGSNVMAIQMAAGRLTQPPWLEKFF